MKKMIHLLMLLIIFSSIGSVVSAQEENQESDQLYEEIQERGVLRMGTGSGYAPFEFIVMEDGENQIVGLDIFLGEQIAADMGVELEVVDMEFASLIPALEVGSIDIIISGMSYTEERDKSVDFSDFYHQDEQYILINESDSGNIEDYQSFAEQDLRMGVSDGTLQETLVLERMPDVQMVSMRKTADVVSALLADQVDGMLSDEAVAKAYAAENPGLVAIPSGLDVSADGKSVALPENQPTLLASINQTIAESVEAGRIDQWLDDSYEIIQANQETNWLGYWPYFWDGTKTTLLISIVAIVVGSILGFLLALARISRLGIISSIATGYVEFVRGTPLMVQVLFIFLGVGGYFGWSSLQSGLVAISLNSGAYICEIIRGGINGVDKGQGEAARSLGLSYWQTMQKVIFPQSLRSIWPSLGNEFISLIKESSIISTIGVAELTFQTRSVTSLTYQGIIPLVISMLIYFILTFTLSRILGRYEKSMNVKYA